MLTILNWIRAYKYQNERVMYPLYCFSFFIVGKYIYLFSSVHYVQSVATQ